MERCCLGNIFVGWRKLFDYVDFKNDVEKMVECLEVCGVEDVKGYYGRDMIVLVKVEIERVFRNIEI